MGLAPKEQPPRKLSGKRTAKGPKALWKACAGVILPTTEGEADGAFVHHLLKLSGYPTEGAGTMRRTGALGCFRGLYFERR